MVSPFMSQRPNYFLDSSVSFTFEATRESFNYAVSHDLRAPLRSMQAFTENLLTSADSKLDDTEKRMGEKVISAIERMSCLIDDLLKLSRLNRGELTKETVDLSEMVQGILLEITSADSGRKKEIEIQSDITVHADPNLI